MNIPEAAVEAAVTTYRRAYFEGKSVRSSVEAAVTAVAPHIAAQERQRVADEIDLPAVMAHLLRGSRDDLILADRINVAIGASRVRRIEADHG